MKKSDSIREVRILGAERESDRGKVRFLVQEGKK